MQRRSLDFFVAATIIGSGLAASASSVAGDAPGPLTASEIRREHEDYARMFDVLLARMRAEVKLTHAQEAKWRRFEAAVRGAAEAEAHLDAATEVFARLKAGDKPSPIERLRMIADRMAKGSDAAKNVANAAEPLYESLTVEEKRDFGRLLQMLVERLPHARTWLHPWGHDKLEQPG